MVKEVKLEAKAPEKELTTEEKIEKAVQEERVRILTILLREQAPAASDYRQTIKHTGGLLTQSMTFAFTKGFQTAFKLITKEEQE